MTEDKKLKAEDVKKGLEEYIKFAAFHHTQYTSIDVDILKNTLDVLKEYESENIALNRRAMPSSGHILKVGSALLFAENKEDYTTTINAIKSEAYKEFWEELKRRNTMDERIISVASGDNLLKELAGEDGDRR